MMPNIGPTGFILIILVALLLFGPSKLPELGRAFGRTLREFKNGAKEMMDDDSGRKEVQKSDTARLDMTRTEASTEESASGEKRRLPE
ncbi:MAG: hypothetical protein K0Q59_1143 [Paenibacillus sp.]|jgi:sec-independent protein translocase protein TatA|nr:hypothetical protein [Paenibacillus sp.]